ncbi:hypothetical protein [Pseudonocardia xishanensis]|uniref:hypothetical protein n=1 Tax=Pseudonocardia xishanensis TaxID=630995 RepID=UPI0031E5D629
MLDAVMYTAMVALASPSTPVSLTRAVNERFDKARGIALGISNTFAGIVVYLVPAILGTTLATDWRTGYWWIGGVIMPCAVIVFVLMPRFHGKPASVTSHSATPRTSILPLLRRPLFARLSGSVGHPLSRGARSGRSSPLAWCVTTTA